MMKKDPIAGLEIPDKLLFRIGEVARLLQVEPYVLRFWESEFKQLAPEKGGSGQRLYRQRDIAMAYRIKQLLYEEGFTIEGAKKQLSRPAEASRDNGHEHAAARSETHSPSSSPALTAKQRQLLRGVRDNLRDILSLVKRK